MVAQATSPQPEAPVSAHVSTTVAPTVPASSAERRAAERFPILQRCLVRPDGATGAGDWEAIAFNISVTGIGLALPCQLRRGTVLLIQPWRLDRAPALRARVVHSSLVEFLWFHGCELDVRLRDELFHLWLRSAPLARLAGAP